MAGIVAVIAGEVSETCMAGVGELLSTTGPDVGDDRVEVGLISVTRPACPDTEGVNDPVVEVEPDPRKMKNKPVRTASKTNARMIYRTEVEL